MRVETAPFPLSNFGSPVWIRFELLRPNTRPVRGAREEEFGSGDRSAKLCTSGRWHEPLPEPQDARGKVKCVVLLAVAQDRQGDIRARFPLMASIPELPTAD